MPKFNIGDRVKVNPANHQSCYMDRIGTVVGGHHSTWYRVRWDGTKYPTDMGANNIELAEAAVCTVDISRCPTLVAVTNGER